MEEPAPPSSILGLTRACLPTRCDYGLRRPAAIVRHILVGNLTLGLVRILRWEDWDCLDPKLR